MRHLHDRARAFLGAALLAWLGLAQSALACACCTEPGQRLERTVALSPGLSEELSRVRFASTASLLADAGFPDTVKGVAAPDTGAYHLVADRIKGRLAFQLTNPAKQSGRIAMALPRQLTRFEVDPRHPASNGHGPELYKEWRLEGEATLSGIVGASGRRGHARLILHGHGNGCTTADHFTHWTLSVVGPDIRFTFLGEFIR